MTSAVEMALSQAKNAMKSNQFGVAISICEKHLKSEPGAAVIWVVLANAHFANKDYEQAFSCFKKVVDLAPQNPKSYQNLGVFYQGIGKYNEALQSYKKAASCDANYAPAYNGAGVVLMTVGQFDVAQPYFAKALQLDPGFADAYNNLAHVFFSKGQLPAAAQSYAKANALNPDLKSAQANQFYSLAMMCDWAGLESFSSEADTLGIEGEAIAPFSLLVREDAPERQLARSRKFVSAKFGRGAEWRGAAPSKRPDKLRIGYFSADFHNHATLSLMMGLLRNHDHEKFEIHGFSYGVVKESNSLNEAKQFLESFSDVERATDEEIVELAREKKIDIAIDLKGHTHQARTGIFAYRMAPIQINYLGYPGSIGADFIEYMIVDKVTVPETHKQYLSEKLIYLPNCYQPNNDQRQISQTDTKRTDFGLPETGFVFCSFNNTYKITPREFDIWMRLLGKVDSSVLWLLKGNDYAADNLRKEAQKRGVDPNRLIFAEKLPEPEHLARHKHADLLLDTFNVNAHTTASDALWAGLPMVTLPGAQFAARVAASILSAANLPELIAKSEEDYEAIALDLALNPEKAIAIRSKVKENAKVCPLFDSKSYTVDLERAYDAAYACYLRGEAPKNIDLVSH
ncbi:tetratricopeptide repeat protein [Thalassospira indica]|uniref:protein O-GlcNAc transferase n=1 Tax=Thalassospira indica TaxID=1891279 RepID=A0ABM6XVQ5_9PROT|nr:tetratricopeptide repeat protein [Thalassospira indica]AXO13426.1 tetratricopeptide repeat protein [Thalassospira indica]